MASFDWLSDLHPLFAAQESWLSGTYNKNTVAQILPEDTGSFAIACGAGLLAEHIRRFRVTPTLIQRLGQVADAQGRSVFQESFLNHLQRLRLRVHVNAAPEGTLLLPGEPVLVAQGPASQIALLESAFKMLVWEPTYWATLAAQEQWGKGIFSEEETPHAPHFTFDKPGWKMRAWYIGGGNLNGAIPANGLPPNTSVEHLPVVEAAAGLTQIRRLFRGEQPLGDVWLGAAQEEQASVSRTHIRFLDVKSGEETESQMSRFQNLLQPVLVKGHPALNSPSLDYLRQRCWKQLEAFRNTEMENYPRGWFAG